MRREVRELLRKLRRDFPPLLPVSVRMLPIDDYGECVLVYDDRDRPCRFEIRLAPSTRHVEEITLLHEWAHALAWELDEHVDDHPDEWGIKLARLYRAFFDQ